MNTKFFLLAGCITALLAVVIGAFGAHGLENILDNKMQAIYETGVNYQFYHSFALIITGILIYLWPDTKSFRMAGMSFLLGIIIFSGSLYLYTLTNNKVFGMVTPLGGLSFLLGWILLAISLWKQDLHPPLS